MTQKWHRVPRSLVCEKASPHPISLLPDLSPLCLRARPAQERWFTIRLCLHLCVLGFSHSWTWPSSFLSLTTEMLSGETTKHTHCRSNCQVTLFQPWLCDVTVIFWLSVLILKWGGHNQWSVRSLPAPNIYDLLEDSLLRLRHSSVFWNFLLPNCSIYPTFLVRCMLLFQAFSANSANQTSLEDSNVLTMFKHMTSSIPFPFIYQLYTTNFVLLSKKEREELSPSGTNLLWIKAHLLIISNFIVF